MWSKPVLELRFFVTSVVFFCNKLNRPYVRLKWSLNFKCHLNDSKSWFIEHSIDEIISNNVKEIVNLTSICATNMHDRQWGRRGLWLVPTTCYSKCDSFGVWFHRIKCLILSFPRLDDKTKRGVQFRHSTRNPVHLQKVLTLK